MRSLTFWKRVVMDRSDMLERTIALLRESGVPFCVVGGVAVNAYAEYPVVTEDLDVAIAAEGVDRIEQVFTGEFKVQRFPYSLNVSDPDSNLRVQIQIDPRYASFPQRAVERDVLGLVLPVADVEDLLQGKVWAASDQRRRNAKRLKDLSDIARLLEVYPHLCPQVPAEILARLD